MKAVALCAFLFAIDDDVWDYHSKIYAKLLRDGRAKIGGEEFVLAPAVQGDVVRPCGIPMATAEHGESVPLLHFDRYRQTVIEALESANVILPMGYGPFLYIYTTGGMSDGEMEPEAPEENGGEQKAVSAFDLV